LDKLQETVKLIREGRYDEASAVLRLVEVEDARRIQGDRSDQLSATKAVMSESPLEYGVQADPALALKPIVSIGQAISLVQNRQERAALKKNTELETFQKFYVDAVALMNIYKYEDAIKKLNLALGYAETINDRIKALVTKALVYLVTDQPYRALSTITEEEYYDENQEPHAFKAIRLLDLEKSDLEPLPLYIISYVFFSCKFIDKAKEYLSASNSKNIEKRYSNYLLGLIHLEQNEHDEALLCFETVVHVDDPNFADAYNGIAVILAGRGELSRALDALRRTLAIDSTNVSATENLAKLSVNIESNNQENFWDFWNSSPLRRGTAIFLSILAIGLVFYAIYLTEAPLPLMTTLTNETTTNGTFISTTITNSTNFSKSQSSAKVIQELPNSYLILIGIVVVIILIPQIRSAKVGEIELELVTPETPSTNTTLRLSYRFLRELDDQLKERAEAKLRNIQE
jgi:tetratricopeptide (TPR) repeat protein